MLKSALKSSVWLALVSASLNASAYAAVYQFDKAASKITWTGSKQFLGDKHTGTVALKEGEVELGKAAKGKVVIDMTTIANDDVKDPQWRTKLEGHLKSPDFFKIDEFKDAVLTIKELKQDAKNKETFAVKADLTLRGTTKEVSFPAKIVEKAGTVEVSGSVTLDRTLWGIGYGSPASFNIMDVTKVVEDKIKDVKDKVIKNEFTVDVNLVGKAKA